MDKMHLYSVYVCVCVYVVVVVIRPIENKNKNKNSKSRKENRQCWGRGSSRHCCQGFSDKAIFKQG